MIEYRKSGVNISCLVNGTNLIGITSIQLKRSESNVVSVSKYTVAWQDKELENKTEVTVNASISDVNASFLHLEIPGSVVRNPKDTGSYQCILSCVTASGRASIYTSQSIVLNITGKNYSLEYVDIKGLLLFCCNNFYLLRFLLSTSFKNKKRTINPKYIYIPNV